MTLGFWKFFRKGLAGGILATAFLVSTVFAGPFLTCDPYPTTGDQPDNFEVTITPLAPFLVTPTKKADGSVILLYDLSAMAEIGAGAHNASAVAIKNGWRSGASNSVPFSKTLIAAPILSISASSPIRD